MTTTPDPKTVREIARIWFYEDGDGACSPQAYTTAEAAQAEGLAEHDPQAVGPDADPELVAHYAWKPLDGMPRFYILTEDGQPTGHKVYGFDVLDGDGRYVTWPDEQPQEFECEVCTKPITAYPCILCEHEPDPWKKPAEQPQDDGDPCAVCYCRGCRQCVNPTPPSEVCFCMKAMRPVTADTTLEASPVPLRKRPIPDQLDYFSEKLAAQINPGDVPREAIIAMGATIVGIGAIATELRKQATATSHERPQDDGDVRAVAQLREELALVSDQAEHAIDLLARTIGSTPCRLDSWGDCDAHGFQGIETGEQCPHALARAFLAGAGRSIAALDARDAKGGESA